MKHFLVASIFAVLVTVAAQAAEPTARVPVLAELFTSEGCSSCPPADSLLLKLDQMQPLAGVQIIVLSEHVDYWNSGGWNDPYSSAQFTRRQNEYDHTLMAENYTPQIVIDGHAECNGSNQKKILEMITKEAARAKLPIKIVSAKRDDKEAVVTIVVGASPRKSDVWVALADERDQSTVRRGENSGRTLTHVAVVRSLGKVGTATKAAGLEKTVRIPITAPTAEMRVVVFVGDSGGQVLGAAMERLSESN